MAKNNNNKADIDFEQELWKAANELRGAVAENQYKDYPLLFQKYAGFTTSILKPLKNVIPNTEARS